MTKSGKVLACWANPCATLLPHSGTTKNKHSLNLVAWTKDPEIKLQILAGGVTKPVRELWTTNESPSKIAELIPWSQANSIPSSIALASISRGPKRAWIFMLNAAYTNPRWSLITNPMPTTRCLSKTAPSILYLLAVARDGSLSIARMLLFFNICNKVSPINTH